jgi:hypothetical protein
MDFLFAGALRLSRSMARPECQHRLKRQGGQTVAKPHDPAGLRADTPVRHLLFAFKQEA